MTFSEYALGLSPYISYGKSEHDYFTELVGNFVHDAAMDSCKLLKRKNDTKYRYITGKRLFQPKEAQYLYDYRDKSKFADWVSERMDDSDSYDNVVDWLESCNISGGDPCDACADLLENVLLDIINGTPNTRASQELDIDLQLIEDIQKKNRVVASTDGCAGSEDSDSG